MKFRLPRGEDLHEILHARAGLVKINLFVKISRGWQRARRRHLHLKVKTWP